MNNQLYRSDNMLENVILTNLQDRGLVLVHHRNYLLSFSESNVKINQMSHIVVVGMYYSTISDILIGSCC